MHFTVLIYFMPAVPLGGYKKELENEQKLSRINIRCRAFRHNKSIETYDKAPHILYAMRATRAILYHIFEQLFKIDS